MPEVFIDLQDLGTVMRKINKLDNQIKGKAGFELCDTVAKSLQKRMRTRVAVATGQLKDSIKVVPLKEKSGHSQVAVKINDPRIGGPNGYAGAQGYGYRPHWVKGSWSSKSGYLFADWLVAKGYETDYTKALDKWYWVKKQSPFVIPSLQSLNQDMPNVLDKWMKDVLKKAEFKA